MPGYDVQEVSKEVSRGDELAQLGGMANVQATLLKSSTFASCHSSFVEEMLLECDVKKMEAGTKLWEKGGKCDEIFILWKGNVELSKDDGLVVYDWGPMSILGTWIFVNVHNHMAAAKAATVVECLCIQTSTFLAVLRQHHTEKKHFAELANIEASELLSDSRWVCLMPSKGNKGPGQPTSPSPVPMEMNIVRKDSSKEKPASEAVAIAKKAFHRRHSAPLIDVGADTHKEIDRVEQSEGLSRWKSAFKRLPSIEPLMKASIRNRMAPQAPRKQLKKRPQRRAMAGVLSESEDELDFTCTMSENLAAWHRPHLGKVQTQVMTPAGDLLLDLSPHGGREATKSKEVPPDLSPASKKANGLYMVISDWFQVFDKDQNGWIDKEEFNIITSHLTATLAWDDHQSDLLLQEIDTKHDDLVDVQEFAEWLTNVNATITVGTDGWLQMYDLADTLKPLYDCFDPDGTGISKDQFLRTYRVIANSLKHTPVPSQEKMDIWVRAAEDEYEALDAQRDMMIDFEDFVQWQVQLLNSSGTPNALMPRKVSELAEALKVISDIDEQGSWHSGDISAALTEAVTKVASVARELYLPCKDQLRRHLEDNMNEHHQEENDQAMDDFTWFSPGQDYLDRLRRDCAIELGVLLPGVMPNNPSKEAGAKKSEVWKVARRNSHLKQRCNTLVLGELVLCVPKYQESDHFLAWVQVPSKVEGEKTNVYYELIPPVEPGEGPKWHRLPDDSIFKGMTQQLPNEQYVLCLLKTQEMVHGQLQWRQVERSVGVAESQEKLCPQAVTQFYSSVRALARQDVIQQPEYHEHLEMGMSVNEMVEEFLEDADFLPAQVLQLLTDNEKAAANELAGRLFKT